MVSNFRVKASKDIEKSFELQEVFSSIAHQWRQPLSEINSIISTLDNRLYELRIEDALLTQQLQEIEKITKKMSQSVDDYRYLFHFQCEQVYSLNTLIKEVEQECYTDLQKHGVVLDIEMQNNIEFFKEKQLLKQVLITLINNARDALVLRNIYKPQIGLKLYAEDNHIFIKVYDNGGGMSKSVMEKIFEPTFTTKHHSEGTGLGLYRVKQLLQERFQSLLDVKNVESGACFSIILPKDYTNG